MSAPKTLTSDSATLMGDPEPLAGGPAALASDPATFASDPENQAIEAGGRWRIDEEVLAPGGLLGEPLSDEQREGTARSRYAEAANSMFATKMSARAKLFVAAVVIVMFFVSFMLGKYALTPIEVIQITATFLPKLFWWLVDWAGYIASGDWFSYLSDPGNPAFVEPPELYMTQPERVLFRIRFPRIAVVMMVGAALAIAGASYQGMFKNPLTSPDLLGASNGAALGAAVALLLSLSGECVQAFAFIGGLVAVALAVWLNRAVDYDPTLGLVLAGILVSTLFQAGMSLVKFMADADDKLPEITYWLMGSFSAIGVDDMLHVIVPMLVGFAILVFQSWKLNVLSFGDEEARAMGVNTSRTRILVIFAATLVTSASVAVSGVVGWVGLVIPHLARAIVGPNYKVLLPTSMFVGASYLLFVDNIARLATTVEVPIGILTAIIGVPFFVVIFKRNMKGWR